MVARVEVARAGSAAKRVMRSPKHSFVGSTRPYQISPFMLAPVLPGETLKMAMLQSRCVTDPIKHPLVGWWHEYYIFYVKLNDLEERDVVTQQLLLGNGTTPASLVTAADPRYYYNGKGVNWALLCMKRVVDEYFRDEGEAWNAYAIDNLPLATVNSDTWLDSAKLESQTSANDHELPGDNPVIPDGVPPGFEAHFTQWEHMRAMQLTTATFEDWLAAFGVKPAAKFDTEKIYRPELIRYVREWQYPSNTVEPTTGIPSSAVSWSVAERADKARFFPEPGFIFGVTVTRPKIYMGRQYSSAACAMADCFSWLPATLHDQPYTSLKEANVGGGPLAHPAGTAAAQPAADIWFDIRDLFVHGDQFIAASAPNANGYADLTNLLHTVALPTQGMQKRYLDAAMIDSLFVTPATANRVRFDGVCQLQIATRITDTSL